MFTSYEQFPIVTPDEFEDGLICGECERAIEIGQPYTEKLEGMSDDIPVTMLVCVYC